MPDAQSRTRAKRQNSDGPGLSQAHENAGENHPHLKRSRASARRLRKVRPAACIDLKNRMKQASPPRHHRSCLHRMGAGIREPLPSSECRSAVSLSGIHRVPFPAGAAVSARLGITLAATLSSSRALRGAMGAMGAEERLRDSCHASHPSCSKNCLCPGAPLRNRTVDLLLTITTAQSTVRANRADNTGHRTDSTRRAGIICLAVPRPVPRPGPGSCRSANCT